MTEENLKRTYRALLKKYHPDTGGENADEAAIRRVIDEYKKLTSRRCSASNGVTKNKNSTIVPLAEWTMPTDWTSADQFILKMIGLIAANRLNEIPIETIGAAIDQLAQLCQDQNNQHHSAVLLTLTGISEMAQLCQKINNNEYDIHYTAVMKRITDYARSICEAANYLDKLSAVNAPKSNLIRDILRSIRICGSEHLKELLNAVLIFVVSLEI